MTQSKRRILKLALVLLSLLLAGCVGGGSGTKTQLDKPIDGLTTAQTGAFLLGREAFNQSYTAESGLGPVFVAPSCGSCHVGDGRGHPAFRVTHFGVVDPNDPSKLDVLTHLGGPVLQNRSIPGYEAETLPDLLNLVTSQRLAPQVAGLGLIEFIDDAEILSRADPDDLDGDGISGRPNYVQPPAFFEANVTNSTQVDGKYLGRFGWKATAITLLQQTVDDYLETMGITSDFRPTDVTNPLVGTVGGDPARDPEVSNATVQNVVFFLRTIAPPPRRDETEPEVVQGEGLFAQIGCASCHTPEMRTSTKAPLEVLRDKPVRLYSDLLLHDMGPELADRLPQGDATGHEFRTAPLWGLGGFKATTGGRAFYLHDGRTSDLREVIKLHGGEADASRTAFYGLSESEQKALIAFLKSL